MAKRKNREYKAALTHFNRVAGQLKRWHDINPADYLEGVTTEKGVNRALKKMRFDAEREDIEAAVEAYEKAWEEAEEERLKEENTEAFIQQHDDALDTLNERYDLDWDQTDSQIFWDAFDDSDLIDTFGSTQILDMGNVAMKNNQITTKQAAEIAKGLAAQLLGSGLSNEKKRDQYDDKINEYLKLRYTKKGRPRKGMTHEKALERLFKQK